MTPFQQLFTIQPRHAIRVHVMIGYLAGAARRGAWIGHLDAWLAHRGLSEANFGRGHLERPPAVAAPGSGWRDDVVMETGYAGLIASSHTPNPASAETWEAALPVGGREVILCPRSRFDSRRCLDMYVLWTWTPYSGIWVHEGLTVNDCEEAKRRGHHLFGVSHTADDLSCKIVEAGIGAILLWLTEDYEALLRFADTPAGAALGKRPPAGGGLGM